MCGLAGSLYNFCLMHALESKAPWLRGDPPAVCVRTPEQRDKAILEKYGPLPTHAERQSEEYRGKYGFLRIPDRAGHAQKAPWLGDDLPHPEPRTRVKPSGDEPTLTPGKLSSNYHALVAAIKMMHGGWRRY